MGRFKGNGMDVTAEDGPDARLSRSSSYGEARSERRGADHRIRAATSERCSGSEEPFFCAVFILRARYGMDPRVCAPLCGAPPVDDEVRALQPIPSLCRDATVAACTQTSGRRRRRPLFSWRSGLISASHRRYALCRDRPAPAGCSHKRSDTGNPGSRATRLCRAAWRRSPPRRRDKPDRPGAR